MPNCVVGVPCGRSCIPRGHACSKADVLHRNTLLSFPKCRKGKPCGRTCIPLNRTCREVQQFQNNMLNADVTQGVAERFLQHTETTKNWMRAQNPAFQPPRGACHEAYMYLTTDLINLTPRVDAPTELECSAARYFCNPNLNNKTVGGVSVNAYGADAIVYDNVRNICPNY